MRFVFVVSRDDGQAIKREGCDLPDIDAARRMVIRAAGDMILSSQMNGPGQGLLPVTITVRYSDTIITQCVVAAG